MVVEMKELGGRSRHSGTVIKKKSSSGCLVIKKKTDSVSASSSRNLPKFNREKKRARVAASESESSDSESETIRGSAPSKGDHVEDREFETRKRASRGLDVFEFDEYDWFDDNRIKKDANGGGCRWNRQSGDAMGSGSGGSRPSCGTTSRFEIEDDEADLPLSVLRKKHRLSSGKAIRVQGKNGVLKVMVNKNKQMGVSHSSYDRAADLKEPNPRVVRKKMSLRDATDGESSMSEDTDTKRSEMKSSLYSDSKHARKPVVSKSKEKSHSRGESVKSEGIVKKAGTIKGKESKVNRGSSTEKQMLREKIKNMLVASGWTIDYRPRRNRDYLDAVYISPSGTGYWSIVKAYDVFQKEEEGNSKDGGGKFTPLPDEVLGKLTRQTQKKKEREMENKRKFEDEKEEESDSYETGRKSRRISRCSLVVRGYDKAENDDGFVPYSGKRTLLTWLIDSGVVHLREHVEYVNRRKTQILQKGWITKDGIQCGCCSKNVTFLKFEKHAGSKLGDPYPNVFLESGKSLMQCQIDAWNKQGELERKGFYAVDADGDDPNDDTCGLCGDGGDLICCDGCPSTFHQTCLDLPMLPQGDWYCPNCSCKYCEIACTNSTQASLVCDLCQKKYHESCRPEIDVKPTKSNYPNLSFCGHACHELYSQLQKLVGVKHDLDSEYSWSFIHRSELSMDASSVQLSQRVECNSMLAVAMSVMDECFLPFTDRRSGINLISNVVFSCGSNLSRLNYSGFFTAILERGDDVVCAASIRIHGTQLAEMPFIGTRHMYRRQGMCRRLLSAIEMALSSLQVEKLMIPAVPEHMDTWTDVFGFQRLEESDKQELKCMNMLVFPRTDMLKKPLLKVKTDSGSRDDAGMETLPINSPCEPQLSGSRSEPNVEESTVQVANGFPSVISGEPEPQLDSNTNLEETDVQNVDPPEVPAKDCGPSDEHCDSLSLDANTATKVKESLAEKEISMMPSESLTQKDLSTESLAGKDLNTIPSESLSGKGLSSGSPAEKGLSAMPSESVAKKDVSTVPLESLAEKDLTEMPSLSPAEKDLSATPSESLAEKDLSMMHSESSAKEDLSTVPLESSAEKDLSATPLLSPAEKDLSTMPTLCPTEKDLSAMPSESPTEKDLSVMPSESPTEKNLSVMPSKSLIEKDLSAMPLKSPTEKDLSVMPSRSPTEKDLSAMPSESPAEKDLSTMHLESPPTEKDLSAMPSESPAEKDLSAMPSRSPTEKDLSAMPSESSAEKDLSTMHLEPPPTENDLSAMPLESAAEKDLSAMPSRSPTEKDLSAMPSKSSAEKDLSTMHSESPPTEKDLSAMPSEAPAEQDLSAMPSESLTEKDLSLMPSNPEIAAIEK